LAAGILLMIKMFILKNDLKKPYMVISLGILMLMIAVSGAVASYPGIALSGIYDRYEGVVTYLAYMMLAVAALNIGLSKGMMEKTLMAVSLVTIIIGLITVFNFYGHELLEISFIKGIIIPNEWASYITDDFKTPLNNPNYVSGLFGALLPFYLTMALFSYGRKRKWIFIGLALISFAALAASISLSGYVSVLLSVPVIVLLAISKGQWKKLLTNGIPIAVACLGILLLLSMHNPYAGQELFSIFGNNFGREHKSTTEKVKTSENKPKIGAPRFDEDEIPGAAYSTGTGRVYIWGKAVHLVFQRPLVGYGPDAFPFYFPQNDKEKIRNLSSHSIIVDKPHSFYLGLAFSSGIPTLLVFIVMMGMYFYHSYHRIMQKKNEPEDVFQDSLLIFIIAFSGQLLFNDSYIGTFVIFWVLLGLSAPDKSNQITLTR
ncbi:MAG: O-antigen ligase family protein, partial [Ignavibacteriales bacterium]